jgi:phosphopantothenoylcysteine decarboxylase/phosphopantothenate--cysteine ligase
MHTAMWEHPATQENLGVLRARGVHVVGPADGPLTGGDSGPGRMAEPDEIVAAALSVVGARDDLAGMTVAVSTGGTREPIDPVRFLGNRSSGRQGAEVALAAADRGARVRLVAAHVDEGVLDAVSRHPRIELARVGTAEQLRAAMHAASADADVVVMVAAVADFRVADVSHEKLRKEDGDGTATLSLVENPDILAELVAARRQGQRIVGFAAETAGDDEELRDRGRRKLARKGADLLVVNRVDWDRGFEAADNEVVILAPAGVVAEASGTKRAVADALWDAIGR